MTDKHLNPANSLVSQAGLSADIQNQLFSVDDDVWIEVIQNMDRIYADLVRYQVELEEKNTELENTQIFIQSVLSSISDILIVCDLNGTVLQINQALEKLVGKPSQELTGQALSALVTDSYRSRILEFPAHIHGNALMDCEIDLLGSEQEAIPMAINCSARYDHKNRVSGFVLTGRPLGELRRAYSDLQKAHGELKTAQQRLVQSEKMASLGRLVAGVAHELNNPISFLYANMHALQTYEKKLACYLAAIHGDIDQPSREKLRGELKIDHMLADFLPLIEGSLEGAERVSDIVQNLRKFTTPQKGEKKTFDLIRVIERATSWVLKASSIKPYIVSDYPDELSLVNSEGHVHQILINLLQNAIDAMHDTAKPQLDIRVRQSAHSITISIRDNGPGVEPQDLVKVFDPFFTTKAVGNGTGLGLYISYGLATEQCEGDLACNSVVGHGAEFVLKLPREAA